MAQKDIEIANTILSQLGGANKVKLFTGAKTFLAISDGLCFKFPQRKRSLPNCVRITLSPTDTYDIEFTRFTEGKLNKKTYEFVPAQNKVIKQYKNIYCDQLVELFEENTMLYLHF